MVYRTFIERPVATALVIVGLLAFGLAAFELLPVASLPEIEYPAIEVQTYLPGASAETVATAVTTPLEQQLSGVFELRSMLSVSEAGHSDISLTFSPGHSMLQAGAEVQAAITAAQPDLPTDLPSLPIWYEDNPSQASALVLAFTSDTLPPTVVDQHTDAAMKQQAMAIPGVRTIISYVRQRRAIRVEVDPNAVAARGLTLEEVRLALQSSMDDGPKGTLEIGQTSAALAANDQLLTPAEVAATVLAWRNGSPVRLGEVAKVIMGPEDETRAFGTFNGRPASAFGLRRSPNANVLQTIAAIKARLADIAASLPPGIDAHVALDRSQAIRAAVSDVESTLVFTTCLVVLVILLFLRRLWSTLIPSIAIPLSLAVTFSAMYVLNFSVNNLTLMALTVAVGFVVDDAIVVIENISRHVEAGVPPKAAAIIGVREVAFTIVSITLSLVAVFIPVLFMGGVVGELFRQFGITIGIALLASGLVSLTITPVLCGSLLREQQQGRHRNPVRAPAPMTRAMAAVRWIEARMLSTYRSGLDWSIEHRRLTLAAVLAVAALTVGMYFAIPKGFLPPQDTGIFRGNVVVDSVLSARAKAQLINEVVRRIRAENAVQRVLSYGYGAMFIELQPVEKRTGSVAEIANRLRAAGRVPGVRFYLTSIPELPLNSWLGRGDYQLTLTDVDAAELREWAPMILKKVQQIPQVMDASLDQNEYGQELKVELDRDVAARLGVKVSAIDETLQDAFGQRRVKGVNSESGRFYVIMQLDRSLTEDQGILQTLYVRSNDGHPIPLSALSTAHFQRVPLTIQHKSQWPAVSLSFNLQPHVALGEAVAALNETLRSSGKPVTVQSTLEGTAGEFEKSLATQPWLIASAILVMYLILGILYESLLHPLTILSTLPSAGLGALLFLRLCDLDLTIIAVVGILLLMGIAKKNAIMIVDYALQAQRNGDEPAVAIRKACLLRLRPIMMTTFAALFGALPLALSSGPGFELRRPLGISIAGGLLVSQLLTLFSTPVVYLAVSHWEQALRSAKRARASHRARSEVSLGTLR